MRRWLVPFLFGALPLALEGALVAWLDEAGAAGVMLGAVSGAPLPAVAATLVALLLRLYCVVALPGLAVLWITLRILGPKPPRRAGSSA